MWSLCHLEPSSLPGCLLGGGRVAGMTAGSTLTAGESGGGLPECTEEKSWCTRSRVSAWHQRVAGSVSGVFLLFQRSVYLSLCQHHSYLITIIIILQDILIYSRASLSLLCLFLIKIPLGFSHAKCIYFKSCQGIPYPAARGKIPLAFLLEM